MQTPSAKEIKNTRAVPWFRFAVVLVLVSEVEKKCGKIRPNLLDPLVYREVLIREDILPAK